MRGEAESMRVRAPDVSARRNLEMFQAGDQGSGVPGLGDRE